MQINIKLWRRLHATALSVGMTHDQLKELCARTPPALEFLDTARAVKIINWIEEKRKTGFVWQVDKWAESHPSPLLGKEKEQPTDEYEWLEMQRETDAAESKKGKVKDLVDDLAHKYDNRKLAMTKVVSIAINKKAHEKSWSHQDILNIAQKEFGTYFNRLSDAQGWYLYYLLDGNLSMMAKWRDKIKEQ